MGVGARYVALEVDDIAGVRPGSKAGAPARPSLRPAGAGGPTTRRLRAPLPMGHRHEGAIAYSARTSHRLPRRASSARPSFSAHPPPFRGRDDRTPSLARRGLPALLSGRRSAVGPAYSAVPPPSLTYSVGLYDGMLSSVRNTYIPANPPTAYRPNPDGAYRIAPPAIAV